MDLGETGYDGIDWIHLAQDRGQWRAPMNTIMKVTKSMELGPS